LRPYRGGVERLASAGWHCQVGELAGCCQDRWA
jgi:hypothetical protein